MNGMCRPVAKTVFMGLVLVALGLDAHSQTVSAAANELDAVMICTPKQEEFSYRCNLRIVHRATNAPLCIHRGSVSFAKPLHAAAKADKPLVQSIELKTDANGEMKDMDIRLETPGIWDIAIKAGDEVIRKSIEVRTRGIHVR